MAKVLLVHRADGPARTSTAPLEAAGFEVRLESQGPGIARACASADLVLLELPGEPDAGGAVLEEIRRSIGLRDVPIIALEDGSGSSGESPAALGAAERVAPGEALVERVRDALRPVGKRTRIDVRVVNAFIQGLLETIPPLTGTPLRRREVCARTSYRLPGDISGAIRISGILTGSVAICFPDPFARSAVSAMLRTKPEDLPAEDVRAGVGEIANIVVGRAKTLLANQSLSFGLSAPVVVSGPGHELEHPDGAPCISILFGGNGGELLLLLAYRETRTPDGNGVSHAHPHRR